MPLSFGTGFRSIGSRFSLAHSPFKFFPPPVDEHGVTKKRTDTNCVRSGISTKTISEILKLMFSEIDHITIATGLHDKNSENIKSISKIHEEATRASDSHLNFYGDAQQKKEKAKELRRALEALHGSIMANYEYRSLWYRAWDISCQLAIIAPAAYGGGIAASALSSSISSSFLLTTIVTIPPLGIALTVMMLIGGLVGAYVANRLIYNTFFKRSKLELVELSKSLAKQTALLPVPGPIEETQPIKEPIHVGRAIRPSTRSRSPSPSSSPT